MNKFDIDLQFGKKYEKICEKYFDNIEYAPNIKFSKYDFISNGIKYEVKCDRLSYKTGNICLEIECYGKPSGISLSESEYYIYFIIKSNNEYDAYKIGTNILRNKMINCKCIYGGDYKKSKFYLLKLIDFKEYLIKPLK